MLFFFFFFSSRRRHTRYIGDWSSDVCSSDVAKVKTPIISANPSTALATNRNTLILRISLNMMRSPYSADFVKRAVGGSLVEITRRSVRWGWGIWRLKGEQN